MPSSRVISGLVVLVVASLAGDQVCRRLATGGDSEHLMQGAVSAVDQLPDAFGPWQVVEKRPLEPGVVEMLQCRGHQSRVYRNEDTGETASLVLLVGPPGPLVAHTPEVCYGSSAFRIVEAAQPETLRAGSAHEDKFDRAVFQSTAVGGELQIVYYAWRRLDGAWRAPRNPRMELGGGAVLYKLQVAAAKSAEPLDGDEERRGTDTARALLNDLLPSLDRLLNLH